MSMNGNIGSSDSKSGSANGKQLLAIKELVEQARNWKATPDAIEALKKRLALAENEFLAKQAPIDLDFRYTL